MTTATMTGPTTGQPLQGGKGDVAALNTLLRGELSAVETYEQALGKFEGKDTEAAAKELRRIRDEHQSAVGTLRARVLALGGTPYEGSGVWGVFTAAITGVAKVMGPHTAVSTLRRGEDHGIGEYEDVLQDEDVSVECKYLVRNELQARCKDHVQALDRVSQELTQSGK